MTTAPPRPRLRLDATTVFSVAIALGAAAALTLGTIEIGKGKQLEFGEPEVARRGLVATVEVEVVNRTRDDLCPLVRMAARDQEGRDLQEVTARPRDASGTLRPDIPVSYVGVFRGITAQEYAEELEEFRAYAREIRPCQ